MTGDWLDTQSNERAMPPRRTLAEEAANTLREYILLEKLAPGMAIPERELAEAMGVSRTPLREALRQLEAEGLVEYSSTRRPHVVDPSLDELAQYISVLGALEGLAGETACAEASDAEIAHIAKLAREIENASSNLGPLEFFRLDMKFHAAIIAASRNEPLGETHRQYNARLWRARFMSSRQSDRRDNTLAEHAAIVDALKQRDRMATRRALRAHLQSTIDNITRIRSASDGTEIRD